MGIGAVRTVIELKQSNNYYSLRTAYVKSPYNRSIIDLARLDNHHQNTLRLEREDDNKTGWYSTPKIQSKLTIRLYLTGQIPSIFFVFLIKCLLLYCLCFVTQAPAVMRLQLKNIFTIGSVR